MDWVGKKNVILGVLKLSGAVCLISLRKEMGFALIMVGLVAEINMPMVLVLPFLHELSHGHSYGVLYSAYIYFLAFCL